MSNKDKNIKVDPLRPSNFGLLEHKARRFDAVVNPEYINSLEDPDLWVNCANKIDMGDEIRCLAEDMSFVAYGICTFKQGTTVKLKIIQFKELDPVDDDLAEKESDFEVKMRGKKKWCISKKSTGEIIKEGISKQAEALKELADYEKALGR